MKFKNKISLIFIPLLFLMLTGCAEKMAKKTFKHNTPLIKTDVKQLGKQELEKSEVEEEMTYEGGKWIGFIPGDRVTVSGLEYVTILTRLDGGKIALPLIDNPFNNPLSIKVRQGSDKIASSKKSNKQEDYVDEDILILSPEDGSINNPGEVVIAASLFNSPNINKKDYKIYVDNIDYSSQTIISGDVLTLVLEDELEFGFHTIKILFNTTYFLFSWIALYKN